MGWRQRLGHSGKHVHVCPMPGRAARRRAFRPQGGNARDITIAEDEAGHMRIYIHAHRYQSVAVVKHPMHVHVCLPVRSPLSCAAGRCSRWPS